jgi:voltage-dependent potassium channel beta subunit
MEYRRMGKAGIKLSELSLGAWVTYGGQVGEDIAYECMTAAWDAGVNFFDNAEGYAEGQAEITMGNVLKRTGWRREEYVVSTKIFWGGDAVNNTGTNYKHIVEGVNNSLRRFQLDYVDLVFCHRRDPETPIEEVVWAMNQVLNQGKAFYWGTSEWAAADIMAANQIARQNGLRPPSMEQPQYNMLWRERMEVEYAPLFEELGYGTTIWSPLASGILTGKYNNGIPEGSRMALKGFEWLQPRITQAKIDTVRRLEPIAADLGCNMAQLSIAWCLMNPDVSTVITGASRREQVIDNMKSLDIVPKLTDEVMERIEGALANRPELIIY